MRTLILVTALLIASVSIAPAQMAPNLTYPETGSFCGFLKPCTADSAKTQTSE